jgi:hypothetical protein
MRTLTLPFLSALSLLTALHAQNSITCTLSTTILCQGSSFVVDYTATGSFDGLNTFQALLSDENGSFTTSVIVGQYSSTLSGQIICSIPVNNVPGSGYRIRVDATDPSTTGEPNTVDIIIIGTPNAGSDGSVALCSNGSPIPLTTGGDPGGTWLDPNMVPTSPVFIPGVDVPGCYTYVVQGNTPCPNDTATLCLTVPMAPNAGQNSTITVCSDGPPFNMLVSLGGSPQTGGTWTDPTGAPHSGIFDPMGDISGCYVYAVAGTPPCADAIAMLCIFVSPAPDAGISVTDTICMNDPLVVMFEQLDGSPQVDGEWSFMGQPHSPFFIPGVDPDGCFQYLVQGIAPCVSDSSVWCVVVDSCLTLGSGEVATAPPGLRQIDGWGTDHPTFAFGTAEVIIPMVLDALGRQVECPASRSRRAEETVFTLDLSGLARGGYWVVVSDGTHNESLRITKW